MITVAIIGAGIGAEHLAAYRALPDLFEVTLICDRDLARAKAMAGDIPVLADMAEALASDADVIDICLPPHLHVSAVIAALEAGKHVICEKPPACSLAEMDALEAAAAQARGQVFPVFQYRFGPAMDQLQSLLASGLPGKPLMAALETHWNRGSDYYAIPWRGTWDGEQGGAVLGHAIHIHDLMCHLLGPVARVTARLATRVNEIETDDCAAILFEMESGAMVTSSVTLGAADDRSRMKLMFEGATVESGLAPYAPMGGEWRFTARAPVTQEQIEVATPKGTTQTGFTGFLRAVANALAEDPAQAVTLADARRAVELVTAIYTSAQTGAPVPLPLAKTAPLYGGWQPRKV